MFPNKNIDSSCATIYNVYICTYMPSWLVVLDNTQMER